MHSQDIELTDDERQECEVYSKPMGYCRPISDFNAGKLSEYNERVNFDEDKMKENRHVKLDNATTR